MRTEREHYATLLTQLEQQVNADGSEDEKTDWDTLYQEDPIEWMRRRESMRDRKEKQAAIQQERGRLQRQQEQEQYSQLEQQLQREQAAILKAIPEWEKDGAKAKSEKAALVEFGKAHGFSDEEMAQVYDSCAVVLLRKAWLHGQLQEKRKALKPAKAAPTIRPGPSAFLCI